MRCGVSLQNRLALSSGLLLRVQEESGWESSKSGQCGGALLRGCLEAVQESSEEIGDTRRSSTVMDGNQPRGGDTSTREDKGCRVHSRIPGTML